MITAEDEKLLKAINAEPVKVFLTAALAAKIKGDGYNYNHIVHQLRVRDDQEMVASVYVGLASCVSQFSQRLPDTYRDLIQSVFSYDWKCDKIVTVAFVNLLSHIISSNVTFLLPILQMLVKNFVSYTPAAPVQALADPVAQAASLVAAQIVKDEKLRRVHRTLQEIITLVPTGLSELFPVIANHFPHKRFAAAIQREYVCQLLQICHYFPMIQERILDLIISKCLEIDVEIVIEDSGEVKIEDEDHGDVTDVIFSGDDDGDNNNANHLSQRVYTEGSQFIPTEVAEMADKLDIVLCQLIEFIQKEIDLNDANNQLRPNSKQNEKIEKLSNQLMRIFEEKILLTHRSKFVQFLLFYFAAKIESFGQKFGGRLVKLFLDESAGHVKRQSAILYLASYSVRANFLSVTMINSILIDLLTWAASYVKRTKTEHIPIAIITPNGSKNSLSKSNLLLLTDKNQNQNQNQNSNNSGTGDILINMDQVEDNDDTDGNIPIEEEEEVDEFGRKQTVITSAVSMHETFFSCVQAACYIVCFYGVEVANSQRNVRTTQKKWQKVLTCTLQPLRFCLQSVRVEFLRLVQQVGMLEESAWLALPSDVLQNVQSDPNRKNNGNVNMGAGFNPLDSFFPYDPCLLIMLHQPIEKYYRVWRGVPGLDDVVEVEIEVEASALLDESRIIEDDVILEISTDVLMGGSEMGLGSHGGREGVDDIVRSRSSSVGSDSESESEASRSMTSSMHLSFSQAQSRSQSMDVTTAMSMTESVGIGLLEEREKEKVQGRGTDSRAQSMVSDCSLEEDANTLSPHSQSQSHSGALSTARVPSFSQFSGIVSPPRSDPGADRNNDLTDAGGWPIPARRPRQDSTCSNGSW